MKYANLLPYYEKDKLEVGIDEAGVGPLAGPLVVAAVIWPQDLDDDFSKQINDSKKISHKNRILLRDYIIENAIDYSIIYVHRKEIDKYNMRQSRLKAYHKVLDKLSVIPEKILMDGDIFNPYFDKNMDHVCHNCIIEGDNKYQSIAAASILAKCERDDYMEYIHNIYPQYGWNKNSGYGTGQHMRAIQEYGITPYHRRSYGICKTTVKGKKKKRKE
jgi:ribonuclease HII